jgi:hypothetical protein
VLWFRRCFLQHVRSSASLSHPCSEAQGRTMVPAPAVANAGTCPCLRNLNFRLLLMRNASPYLESLFGRGEGCRGRPVRRRAPMQVISHRTMGGSR